MKCEVVQQNIVLVSYGELPDEDLAALEQHLAECADCSAELQAMLALHERMTESWPLEEPSPNLVARARLHLDEELDTIPPHGFLTRLRANAWSWLGHVQSAPALATLLLGVGYLSGNFVNRYQAAHQTRMPQAVVLSNPGHSVVANINSITQMPDSEIVQVNYNRIVPETVQGSLDDPQIRQLLLTGTKAATDSTVRSDSVTLLAGECRIQHQCMAKPDGTGIRNALLVSLRYDKSPTVRLRALDGLEPYVAEDQHVRDAILEALMHDGNSTVRTRAISLLAPVDSDSSVRQVMRTVSTTDANPYIRTVSTQALAGTADIQ